jgi:hypothetical protein
MRRAAAWLASLVAAALAGAALAQGTRPGTAPGLEENRREVRAMVEAFEVIRHAEALMGTMRSEMIRATVRASGMAEDAAASVVDEILMPNFRARSGELVTEMMEPYAVNFTISDLRALRAFFGSPLGQKWLRAMPAARTQGEQAGLAWGQRVFQDSVDRHADELRARGLKF